MIYNIERIVENSKKYFNSNKTKDVNFRIVKLNSLEKSILKYSDEITDALKNDLNKSKFESLMSEINIVLSEISSAKKNLKNWAKPKTLKTSFTQMPAKTKSYYEPLGTSLIISPWNYPFQLCMIPIISAIAAGNTVIVKPSAYSRHSSDIVEKIITEAFDSGLVSVIKGGREENVELLDCKFDYIFFTGSPIVGKLVMQKAAEHLTPLTLELGGKSPCIIAKDADVKLAAKRIAFGKLLNSGQICVAPDYALISENLADKFIEELIKAEKSMLQNKEYASKNFPKIINEKHKNRLLSVIEESTPIYSSELYDETRGQVPFTIIKNPPLESKLMQEEIFGPVLPVLTYSNIEESIAFIKQRPKPLALYLFTNDSSLKKRITSELSYGGGCINDTIIHLASHAVPFGGVGNSGMGNYHGKYGFDTFSHKKSVLSKRKLFDLAVRYHPIKNPDKTLPLWLFK